MEQREKVNIFTNYTESIDIRTLNFGENYGQKELKHSTFLVVVDHLGQQDDKFVIYSNGLHVLIVNNTWAKEGFLLSRMRQEESIAANEADYFHDKVGILIGIDSDGHICAWTDRFSSIPCYFAKINGKSYLSNDIGVLLSIVNNKELDLVGLWEKLLFDFCMANRTPYKDIKQLPFASKVCLGGGCDELINSKYWNFKFETGDKTKIDEVAFEIKQRLIKQIISIAGVDKIILPISGGLDSRLLAYLVSEAVDPEKIITVNFASSKRSLDHIYAGEICSSLGIRKPIFHIIDEQSYKKAIPFLTNMTAGIISPAHAHLLSWLTTLNDASNNYTMIHGFFADASGGFASTLSSDSSVSSLEQWKLLTFAEKQYLMPNIITDEIREDICSVKKWWENGSSITSLKEYLYVAVKHPAFHLALADLYGRFVNKLYLPHCQPRIADLFFELPPSLRLAKRGVREIIRILNPKLSKIKDVSSFPHAFTPDMKGRIALTKFKIFNLLESGMGRISNGKVMPFNKFQTERQSFILRGPLKKDVIYAIRYLIKIGILTENIERSAYAKGWSCGFLFTCLGMADAIRKVE
ncbi:MAG: hypothetical protein V1797_10590 [Pseudomonadota bacterium]